MGIELTSPGFCCVCGTEHRGPATCPGDLRATGAERPGWRVDVETPFGQEAIGVLLAPSHDLWRARIVTYPNVLWAAPGGRGAIKFVGDTREAAEAQAIAFVERHVHEKRYLRRDGLAPVAAGGAAKPEARSPRPVFTAKQRKSRCLPVRYGLERAVKRGTTFNLSSSGMFVAAATPERGGRSLVVNLDINGHTLPLHGVVMWNRTRSERERPAGMGILLEDAPRFYQAYVDAIP